MSPILHEDGELTLERPEETSNRFFREPTWLADIAVMDFPTEHWFEDHILRSFSGFGDVVEIAPVCLTGHDFSPLRVVVAVNNRLNIPYELWISAPNGMGAIAQLPLGPRLAPR